MTSIAHHEIKNLQNTKKKFPDPIFPYGTRRRVFEHIKEVGVSSVVDVSRSLGISWRVASHHLNRLTMKKVLKSKRDCRRIIYFIGDEPVVTLISPLQRSIFEKIMYYDSEIDPVSHLGIPLKRIQLELGIYQAQLGYHLKRFEQFGIAQVINHSLPEGRKYPTEKIVDKKDGRTVTLLYKGLKKRARSLGNFTTDDSLRVYRDGVLYTKSDPLRL